MFADGGLRLRQPGIHSSHHAEERLVGIQLRVILAVKA